MHFIGHRHIKLIGYFRVISFKKRDKNYMHKILKLRTSKLSSSSLTSSEYPGLSLSRPLLSLCTLVGLCLYHSDRSEEIGTWWRIQEVAWFDWTSLRYKDKINKNFGWESCMKKWAWFHTWYLIKLRVKKKPVFFL